LIKQGAKLVSCVDDILEEFNFSQEKSFPPNSAEVFSPPDLANEEALLYAAISAQALTLDEIVEKTNIDISKISSMLLRLQIKKLIHQLPGKQFVRNLR
jgi:DNA processing protein